MTAAAAARTMLPVFAGARSVIDFLEELVVLTDLGVVRRELESLLVRFASLVELSFVLVGNRQVIVGLGIGGIELDRFFPAVDRLAPQPALRDVDAELDLRFGVASRIGKRWRTRHQQAEDGDRDGAKLHEANGGHYNPPDAAEQGMCHA